MTPKILAFAGSTRNGSLNRQALDHVVAGARTAGAEVTLIDLRDYSLPLYNGDLEQSHGLPEAAARLKELFKSHQGLLLGCPEYNSSITPLLKNTLDWVSRQHGEESGLLPYQGKVAALVSASAGNLGGMRGLRHVREILTTLQVLVIDRALREQCSSLLGRLPLQAPAAIGPRHRGPPRQVQLTLATPQNVGHMADGDDYPAPKDRTEVQGTLQGVLFPASFMIGEQTLQVANSSKVAFNGGELKRRVRETTEDAGKYMEQIFLVTHGTGRIGTVEGEGAAPTNTFIVAKPEGSLSNLFYKNRMISVRTTDGGDTASDTNAMQFRKITGYDRATRTLTYSDTDQTVSAGEHIHIVTKTAQTSLSTISPNGLRGLVDDGTYAGSLHGQTRTGQDELKAVVHGNGGTLRALDEQLLVALHDDIFYLTGKTPTDIWTNLGQARSFLREVAPDRRYVQQGRDLTPRWSSAAR